MWLNVDLTSRALVHERLDDLTGCEVEDEAECYGDGQGGQSLAEYGEEQEGETKALEEEIMQYMYVHE